ncbi:hypothetical protein F4141_20990 [Candidatus Poribacteria bacterium]|nr:hypothetical protein [Candidatus Poribacteria bacterium]MYH83165.1 hypothetical protein [Candidatus Poribacteria bacterium]
MDKLKRAINFLLVAACVVSTSVFYGCGADSLGPYQPLLPAVDGEAKFSNRFQLAEEPQFFYDLYGKEIVEGNELNTYTDQKEFDQNGKLVVGWGGQLDSLRFTTQLDRTILVEETFLGRHTEFAIGDHMRFKPATLFPNRYILYKTEFDGLRWDISFAQEHHLFSLIHSRISNPIKLTDDTLVQRLAGDLGRRNGLNQSSGVRNIENARLIGFRGQGLLGEMFRVGFTYVNLHKEHPERLISSLMGTVANTPPERISVVFRDDSPEDNHTQAFTDFRSYDPDRHSNNIQAGVGAAFKSMKITIVTQGFEKLSFAAIAKGVEPALLPEMTHRFDVFANELVPVDHAGGPSEISDAVDGQWKIVNGFNKMKYDLILTDEKINIDPRTVKSVVFDMVVAGDYNIAVIGFSEANRAEESPDLQEWIKTTDGRIQMPYRDVIQAPGNYGQSPDYTKNRKKLVDNPTQWKGEGRPRKVRYRYGAARAATLYGLDLEGTVSNVFVRAHYSINGKYKQYPTIPKDKIGFSRTQTTIQGSDGEEETGVSIDFLSGLPVDANGIPTYSETEGERFEAFLGGDGTDENGDGKLGRETAWFVQLKSRFGKLHLEGVVYHIDPGYTTNYLNFGAHPNRGQIYTLERNERGRPLADLPEEQIPWDAINYTLVEDDDDDNDLPDNINFNSVIPHADDRDQNGVLDYQEDFLIFDADPPVFTSPIDLNNNGTIDTIEDDFEPEYEYGIDRQGYHLKAKYNLLDNLTVQMGWLNESEISSRRKNNSKYIHVTYKRDIPDFGSFDFQNRFVRAQDDIPDYTLVLPVGELEPIHINDELDFYNARVNTTTLQCIYTAVSNLTLEAKLFVLMQKQFEQDAENALFKDVEYDPGSENFEPDERVDFMVPIDQVRLGAFYPDHGINALDPTDTGLIYNAANWKKRRYPERNIRSQLTILKARYEIPLVKLPYVNKIAEDLTLTPMVKYVWDRAFDRTAEEIPRILNPDLFLPTDDQPIEYLRFNRRSREDILGIRLDYQFTQRLSIIGGFQYRKFTNRDKNFRNYLQTFPADTRVPNLYRSDLRTRIFETQIISRGSWLGFYIIILSGHRRTTNLFQRKTSHTTFVRAMMGF